MHIVLIEDSLDPSPQLLFALDRGDDTVSVLPPDRLAALEPVAPADIVVVELAGPLNGAESTISAVRRSGCPAPIIAITDVDDPGERAARLREGAADCLSRPFDRSELIARIQAIARRRAQARARSRLIALERLTIDQNAGLAFVGPERLKLTPQQFQVLEILARRFDKVVSKGHLGEAAVGQRLRGGAPERTIDVVIYQLRRKLAQADAGLTIETAHGEGVRLIATAAAPATPAVAARAGKRR